MRYAYKIMAAAAAFTAFGAQAQGSEITLSGVIDLGARITKNSAGTSKSIVSGSNSTSRLIIRGTEDLGGGLKAGFWLEGTMFADNGTTSAAFWDRQANVRLSGPWGEVRLGRDWVPSFLSYASADAMGYTGVGVAGNLITAGGTTAIRRAFGNVPATTSRSNNAIEYWLPDSLGGFYGQVMAAPGEGANASGSFNLYATRIGYNTGSLNVSAHITSTRIDATDERWSESGVTGLYTLPNGVWLSAAFIEFKYMSSKQRNLILGLRVPVGQHQFRASYGRADQRGTDGNGASIDANDAQLFAVGYVYNLSKRTAAYGTVARVTNKGQATFTISGGPAGARPGTNYNGYEVGLRHAF